MAHKTMTLEQVRTFALSLPEAHEEPHFDRTSFRIRGKVFLTARPSEDHVNVFVPEEARVEALDTHPESVSELLWGKKPVGLRVELAGLPTAVMEELVRSAWESKAPKKVVQQYRIDG